MIRVFLLLSAFQATPAADEDVQGTAEILAEPRYRFCHEDDYPLVDSERAFCAFVDDEPGVCPALAKACQTLPTEVESNGGSAIDAEIEPGARAPTGRTSGGDDRIGVRKIKHRRDGDAKPSDDADGPSSSKDKPHDGDKTSSGQTPKPDEPEKAPPPKPDPQISSAASGFARILFFVLLAGFIVFILRTILKNVLDDSDAPPEEVAPDEPAPTAQSMAATAARGIVETDVNRLLARARAAAQRGAFAQAIDDLYAALLRRLDGDGIIDIQPSRTNGDYLRDVRRERSEIAPDVRAVLTEVESVHFGARSPSAELFSRIHDRVVPLVSKALGVILFFMAVSGTISCGHLGVDNINDIDDNGKAVFRGDSSPSGIHGIASLVELVGVDMRQHLEPLEKLPDPAISTLVLLPGFDVDDIGRRRLLDWVKQGGHLVFAGGHDFPDWTGVVIESEQTARHAARPVGRYAYQFGNIELSLPSGSLLRCSETDTFLARDGLCYAAHHPVGDNGGDVFVFADDRWFMNITLPFGDNAAFLLSFFGALHRNVHVLDKQTSLGADTPIESIVRANLWPILLQLFLLLGLAFLWQGRAFGTLRDPTVERRRAFVDHVRALGRAYARAGASRHVLGMYAAWAIERLRERVPREGRRGLSGLAEALAIRMGKSTGEVMTALIDVTDAQKEMAPVSQRPAAAPRRAPRKDKSQVAADFALFRAIDQWLASTSRDRRDVSNRSSDKKTRTKRPS